MGVHCPNCKKDSATTEFCYWCNFKFVDIYERAKKEVQAEYDSGKIVKLEKEGIKSFKELSERFTRSSLERIETLWLEGNVIENFEGIDLFPNVVEISLIDNKINDLTKFPMRHWKTINLEHNKIELIPESFYNIINSIRFAEIGMNPMFTLYLYGNPIQKTEWSSNIKIDNLYKTWLNDPKRGKYDSIPTMYIGPIDNNLISLGIQAEVGKNRSYFSEGSTPQAINKFLNLKKSGCYVATAVMGDYDHPVVVDLRNFRDNWLINKSWGTTFIKWYYHYGAIAAKFISRRKSFKVFSYLLIVKPLHFLVKIFKLHKKIS